MYAESDDAPFRGRRKSSAAIIWIAALIGGMGVTGGALYIASESMGNNNVAAAKARQAQVALERRQLAERQQIQRRNDLRAAAQKEHVANWQKDEERWQRSSEYQAQVEEQQAREAAIAWTKEMEERKAVRQTSFHDNNYVPQGARNVIPNERTYADTKPATKKQQEIVVVGKEEPRLRDYCPYREGSIERRNCKMQMDLQSRNTGR